MRTELMFPRWQSATWTTKLHSWSTAHSQ